MLVSRAGHYYCSCLAINLLELLKRALYRYQAVETRREFPGYPQRKPSGCARRLFRNGTPFRAHQAGRGHCGVHVMWACRSPKTRRREADRQTEQSNGYGPGLKMLEIPNISTLTGAASVVFRFHLCDSKSPRLYCCKVSVGVALVC